MAIVVGDWTIERDNGNIRYIGGDHDGTGGTPSYVTVLELHRWVQDLADDAVASGDDELDITNTDPSARSTDNIITLKPPYNITDTEAEHIYDGSIIQDGGNTIYDGIVNFGNIDVQIQIIQSGSIIADDWWNYGGGGLNASVDAGISHRFMIKTRQAGVDIDNRKLLGINRRYGYTYGEFSINATSRGNNVLALSDSSDLNNITPSGSVAGWSSITNLNEGYIGLDVNNNGSDEYYYSEWDRDTYTINQFYERMKYLTRDGSSETLYGLNGEIFRGITHQVPVNQLSGTFVEPELVTWGSGSTVGSGQLLAIDSTTVATKMWIQLLTGVIPAGNVITGAGGATAQQTGSVISRPVSTPFCGVSTGTALIGAYGLSLQVLDLTAADTVTDLDNNPITPPNYVTNTVAGLVHGEDRVLVAPWSGSLTDSNGDPAINKSQLSLDTALTTDNITQVEVTETIPSDTPSTGYIRVTDNNGFERRLHYNNWENGTPNRFYNIDTTDGNEDFAGVNANVGNDVYIAYIDELAAGSQINDGSLVVGVTYVIETVGTSDFTLVGAASNTPGVIFTATGTDGGGNGTVRTYAAVATFTSVQAGSRDLVVIVRDGGSTPIKQFISAWSQTSSNQTITAIRTTDV